MQFISCVSPHQDTVFDSVARKKKKIQQETELCMMTAAFSKYCCHVYQCQRAKKDLLFPSC